MKTYLAALPCLFLLMPCFVLAEETAAPAPEIVLFEGETQIFESLILRQETDLTIRNTAEFQILTVMAPNKETGIDVYNGTFTLPCQSQVVEIIGVDYLGREVHKTLNVTALDDVEAFFSLQEPAAMEAVHTMTFDHICTDQVSLSVRYGSGLTEIIDCTQTESVAVTLDQPGTIKMQAFYTEHPDQIIPINGQDEISFVYAPDDPVIEWTSSAVYSNEDISVSVTWPLAMQEGRIIVDDGTSRTVYAPDAALILQGVENREIAYTITLEATDAFGRSTETSASLFIDRRAPVLSLFAGNQMMDPGMIHPLSPDVVLMPAADEESTIQIRYFVNQQEVFGDLNPMIRQLQADDFLEIQMLATDRAGNTSFQNWMFQVADALVTLPEETLPEQEEITLETVVKEELGPSFSDYRQTERVWNWNADTGLSLQVQESEVVDQTGPIVKVFTANGKPLSDLKTGDRICITIVNNTEYSQDTFDFIRINGQKVPAGEISIDALNNEYYEFVLTQSETRIEVRAVDAHGNATELTQTLQADPWRVSLYPAAGAIVLFLIVCILLKILYDKNRHTDSREAQNS